MSDPLRYGPLTAAEFRLAEAISDNWSAAYVADDPVALGLAARRLLQWMEPTPAESQLGYVGQWALTISGEQARHAAWAEHDRLHDAATP